MSFREIPADVAKAICAKYGADQVIIYARAGGHSGGECVAYAGSNYRNGRIAEEMTSFLKRQVFGWSDTEAQAALDAQDNNPLGVPEADEGPGNIGGRIITEGLERRGKKR
jgi:hypothetical protein